MLWRHDTVLGHNNAATDIVERVPVCTDQLIAYANGTFCEVPLRLVLDKLVTA